MAKTVTQLAEELEFKTKEEYFQYFSDTRSNGQFGQLKELLSDVKAAGAKEELVNYLKASGDQASLDWILLND